MRRRTEEETIQQLGLRFVRDYFKRRWPGYCLLLEKKKKVNGKIVNIKYIEAPVYHVENEGKRNKAQQSKAKAMGLVSGVWDLDVVFATNGHAGLKIEVKSKKGVLSPNQKTWGKHYENQGYKRVVCRTPQEILKAVVDYMEWKND